MFKALSYLLLFSVMPLSSHADLTNPINFKDPTRPPDVLMPGVLIEQPKEEPRLSAIWITAKSRWVTINHIQAKQGETIAGDIKILKIRKNEVTITQNGTTKILRLLPSPYKIK